MAGVLEASMADGLFLAESSLPFFVWKKLKKNLDMLKFSAVLRLMSERDGAEAPATREKARRKAQGDGKPDGPVKWRR